MDEILNASVKNFFWADNKLWEFWIKKKTIIQHLRKSFYKFRKSYYALYCKQKTAFNNFQYI